MEWMQALAIIVSMLGAIGGLGFFFQKTIDRLDRNFEEMKREHRDFQESISNFKNSMHDFMKELHGRVCVLEEKKKK